MPLPPDFFHHYVTPALAVIGSALGVLNTYWRWTARRTRLRVHLLRATEGDFFDAMSSVGIEVVNLSDHAVTITDAGFIRADKTPQPADAGECGECSALPCRMEPRDTATFACPLGDDDSARPPIRRVYALTACGVKVTARVCAGD